MAKIKGFQPLVDALGGAIMKAPSKYKELQKDVATRYFAHLDQHAPPDEEGRLRRSLRRLPYKGQEEWVEEYNGSSVEAGTKVYYAPMVNDGHVIGKRAKGHNHRKKGEGASGGYVINKGFVPGTHFAEKALKTLESELPRMAQDFIGDVLKEVNNL